MGGLFENSGGGTVRVLRCAMLNVPTLWTVFVVNFLALGLIWAYVSAQLPQSSKPRGSGPDRRSRPPPVQRWRCCASR